MTRSEGWLPRCCLITAALVALAQPVVAQDSSCSAAGDSSAAAERARWSPPLDRRISVRASTLSLREALDRIAASARVRLSYSPDVLPLDEAVCLGAHREAVGDVLVALLRGTRTSPLAVSGDLIAIAPTPSNVPASKAEPVTPVNVLDRVLVTGNGIETSARDLTLGTDVIDGRRLVHDNTSSLGEALNSYTAGAWSWPQSPASMITSFASMRGASSFGVSYPKIYVDGIEVANPLLVSRFSPEAVDRIEVIRGPQGSALYGTDAISGVINIDTRYRGADDAAAGVSLRSSGGVTQSAFGRDAFSQAHELSVVGGTSTRSASLYVSGGSIGDFIPEGHSRQMLANATGRIVAQRATFSGSARFFTQQAGSPVSPLLANTAASFEADDMRTQDADAQQSVSEYTLASNAVIAGGDRWTHTIVAGIDGYRLSNIESNLSPIPSSADSALRAAQGGADRATLRASSTAQWSASSVAHGKLTLAAEHTTLRASTFAPGTHVLSATNASRMVDAWQNTTSLSGELDVSAANTFYLTGGLRLESDSRLQTQEHLTALPMLGTAIVRDVGPLTIKMHSAYGRGIRPPATLVHSAFTHVPERTDALGAEMQSGIESGVDLALNRALVLRVTRFDQRASGLIQQVATPDTELAARHMLWSLQNVGEITNRGWEIESSSQISRLDLIGAFSMVDSRVRRLAVGYTGDLRTGDRMLQVPARTASLTASWNARHWFASVGGSRAFDWVNYDEVAYARDYLGADRPAYRLLGSSLRQYWRRYDGGLRLHAHASRDLRDNVSVEISADNLLGYQLDEPDNATVLPGRTLMTGFRFKF